MTHAPTQSQAREMPRLTREQAAIVGAFTGISAGPFSDIQEYADKVLGRATMTHEFADPDLWAELKEKAREDFMRIAFDGSAALTPASDDATVERVRGLHGALKAFSADPSNKRVIHVHLDRDATAEDRQALLDALNSAVLPPRPSDDVAKLREAVRSLRQEQQQRCGSQEYHEGYDNALGDVLDAIAALADGEKSNG